MQAPTPLADYLNITFVDDSFRLPSAPAAHYLIYSFEIVLADTYDKYLLLVNSSYALEGNRPAACIWSPPFVSFHGGYSPLFHREVGEVRRFFKTMEGRVNQKVEIDRALYNLGAVGAHAEPIGDILEYKRSMREPEKHKCYKVRRFRVQIFDELALLNACDPENLMGHVFLPLNTAREMLTRSDAPLSGARYFYRGRPLASHLCELLDKDEEIHKLAAHSTVVPDELLAIQEEGLLVRIDVSGYGQLCEYVRENMGTFKERGHEVEQWLNGALYRTFWQELTRCGNVRIRMEGDGFLAAFPLRDEPNYQLGSVLKRILQVYLDISKTITTFNEFIHESGKAVSCRCVILRGGYRYGKIGQLLARGGEFEGPAITYVTRLDQALKEEIKAAAEAKLPIPSLAVQASLFEMTSIDTELGNGSRSERKTLTYRELTEEVVLCWRK